MSRSYRKVPTLTDGGPRSVPAAKRFANKQVRRTKDIPNGMTYRKVFCTWDIHDYTYNQTWKSYLEDIKEDFGIGNIYRHSWNPGPEHPWDQHHYLGHDFVGVDEDYDGYRRLYKDKDGNFFIREPRRLTHREWLIEKYGTSTYGPDVEKKARGMWKKEFLCT